MRSSSPSNLSRQATGQWHLSGQIADHEPVRQFPIFGGVFTIGRKPGSTLCLPLACVSGNHAEFEVREGRLTIRDLGSTNGTFINGGRLNGEREVVDGDLVQFAALVFRVGKSSQQSEGQTVQEATADRALAIMQFDRLINDGNVFPYFQPIVRLDNLARIGFEVLGRSRLRAVRDFQLCPSGV